jgi:hypothetical protein
VAGRRFNGGEGVLMAGESDNEVLLLEEEMGDEGRSTAEGDDGRGWELTEGAVGGCSGFTSDAVGVPPAVGHGQEARGGGEMVLVACLRRRKRVGKRKGQAASAMPFISATGSRERRWGVWAEAPWKRETGGERGSLAWRSALACGRGRGH